MSNQLDDNVSEELENNDNQSKDDKFAEDDIADGESKEEGAEEWEEVMKDEEKEEERGGEGERGEEEVEKEELEEEDEEDNEEATKEKGEGENHKAGKSKEEEEEEEEEEGAKEEDHGAIEERKEGARIGEAENTGMAVKKGEIGRKGQDSKEVVERAGRREEEIVKKGCGGREKEEREKNPQGQKTIANEEDGWRERALYAVHQEIIGSDGEKKEARGKEAKEGEVVKEKLKGAKREMSAVEKMQMDCDIEEFESANDVFSR